jgi:uncharacterized membrane protein affecting hemolysin expression/class 3 adenylate cyclase
MKVSSLKTKIALCFCSLILLTLSTFWLFTKSEFQQTIQRQGDALGTTLAVQSADSVRELVLANDLLSLNVVLDQLTRNENILSISVFNIDEQLIASSGTQTPPVTNSQANINAAYRAPITLDDSIAGAVLLQLDTSVLQAGTKRSQQYFWLILGLGLLLAITAAFALASHITTPILAMINAILEPEEYTLIDETERSDEVALLQNICAELLLQHKQEAADQQGLSPINDALNSTPHTQPLKVMASMLIVEVVNINTAIELLHPSTLSKLLNEYLFYLKQAAKLYGGNVQRFTGESVMVAFDSRQSSEEYSFNAVCCAQLFLMLMNRVSQQHRAEASQALEFRLAIHSGEAFFTLATDTQQEIHNEALIGKVIETSYFLSKQSKPSQLIISETTYAQAGGDARLSTDGSTEITMPTDNMSFMAYILDGAMADYAELLEKQCRHILPGD